MKENYSTYVCDDYEEQTVAFTDGNCLGAREEIARNLEGLGCQIFSIQHTLTTTEVRQAYLCIQENKEASRAIFPDKKFYTAEDIAFAQDCLECLKQGQDSIDKATRYLRPIEQSEESKRTLSILLLDCQGNIAKTAEKLNLHTNSVKYRVQKLNSQFGSDISRFPLQAFLAFALGILRVLES